MAIMATAGESKNFTPAPSGVHQAVCVDVIDKGILEVTYSGQTKKQHKVSIAWQIGETRDDGKHYLVYKRYTLSLNEKATLRKDLESWRGRPFTREEEMGFDVETVIGANALINIQHATSADRTYANVISIMPLVKGMAKMNAADSYVREQDRKEANADGAGAEHNGPLTDDDIPFAWLMPLILPMVGLIGAGLLA